MCIGTTSINTRTCSRQTNAFNYSAVMPPRRKRSCITVLREYHRDDVDVNETPCRCCCRDRRDRLHGCHHIDSAWTCSVLQTPALREGRGSARREAYRESCRHTATPPTLKAISTSKMCARTWATLMQTIRPPTVRTQLMTTSTMKTFSQHSDPD